MPPLIKVEERAAARERHCDERRGSLAPDSAGRAADAGEPRLTATRAVGRSAACSSRRRP